MQYLLNVSRWLAVQVVSVPIAQDSVWWRQFKQLYPDMTKLILNLEIDIIFGSYDVLDVLDSEK